MSYPHLDTAYPQFTRISNKLRHLIPTPTLGEKRTERAGGEFADPGTAEGSP